MIYGLIADRKIISAKNLNTFSVFVCTISLFGFYAQLQFAYWSQILYAVFFAIGNAGFNSLTTMYLVELVGLEKFINATGIVNLFRGFGCFLGPFISGLIADRFKNKDVVFLFAGICFFVGLIFTSLVSLSNIRCLNKEKRAETQTDA